MKLSKNQIDMINGMIREEAERTINGRNLSSGRLVEYGPGEVEDRVDVSVLEQELDDFFDGEFDDDVSKLEEVVRRKTMRLLVDLAQKYNMGHIDIQDVRSILDSDENDDVMDAQMECYNGITIALVDYTKALGKILIKTARSDDEGEMGT